MLSTIEGSEWLVETSEDDSEKSTQEFSLEGTGDLEESEDKGSTTVPNTDEQSTKVKISNTDEGITTEENQGESDEVENGLEIILPNSLLQYEYYTIESECWQDGVSQGSWQRNWIGTVEIR